MHTSKSEVGTINKLGEKINFPVDKKDQMHQLVTFQKFVLGSDVFTDILPNSFSADVLSYCLNFFPQFDTIFCALLILYKPKNLVCVHCCKHKLRVIGKVDFTIFDGLDRAWATLVNSYKEWRIIMFLLVNPTEGISVSIQNFKVSIQWAALSNTVS